ncbi:HAD-IA family hydrolase [Altererythrobacter sp. TH136]|uniref:HAD-IA family hydrolase n=1 Tax=Altererythrobacter sp. TH136 TaxID=2067415 RepID=UPI001164745E|nr:HAD-IA family hydrolase [Altererythrobacter sp. TH136]QDM39771.1 HAD-IA family hydrolase [Altererythrobacter sp. TH136]
MADFPFDIVGFDLDGTLLETHRDLGAAVNHALGVGGFEPVPVEAIENLIGGGAKMMLKRVIDSRGGLPDEEFRRLYKALLAFYAENNCVHTRPYPGAADTLDALAGRGVRLALVTNKFESFARAILERLSLAQRFEVIIGGDTLGKGRSKPTPDPLIEARARLGNGRFVYIGDSSYDVLSARAARVPVVVAAYGYCDKPPAELGGDVIIANFAELIPALETM